VRTWSVFPGDIRDVRKWTSCVRAFESYCITAGECIPLVSRGHFRSLDKDGGHTIGSAVFKNPALQANLMALSVIEQELWAIELEVYIEEVGILDVFGSCDLDLDPMTFIYKLDRYAWRYTGCANTNILRQGVRKLSSDRQTYVCIHTDRIDQNYKLRRFAGGQLCFQYPVIRPTEQLAILVW